MGVNILKDLGVGVFIIGVFLVLALSILTTSLFLLESPRIRGFSLGLKFCEMLSFRGPICHPFDTMGTVTPRYIAYPYHQSFLHSSVEN